MPVRSVSGSNQVLPQRLYTLAYILLIIKYTLEPSLLTPWPGPVDTLFSITFVILLSIKLVFQSYTVRNLICSGIVAAICLYSSLNAHYTSPLLSLLLILALQDVDLSHVLRIGYRTKTVIIAVHVICYIAFILVSPESVTIAYRSGIPRHYFFLGHPNFFTTIVVWTCLEFLYVNYDRIRGGHLAVILFVNAAFYYFTGSRSGFFVLLIVTVFAILDKVNFLPIRAVAQAFARYGFGVFSVICIALTAVYTPAISSGARKFWLVINDLFHGRLVFGAYAYHDFGYTWLGRVLRMPEKVYYNGHWLDGVIFDNSYQWLFLLYGSVFLIIIALAFFLAAKKMNNIEKIIICAFILFAMTENYIVNVAVCFPLLLVGKYIRAPRIIPDGSGIDSSETSGEGIVPLWKSKSV